MLSDDTDQTLDRELIEGIVADLLAAGKLQEQLEVRDPPKHAFESLLKAIRQLNRGRGVPLFF